MYTACGARGPLRKSPPAPGPQPQTTTRQQAQATTAAADTAPAPFGGWRSAPPRYLNNKQDINNKIKQLK